MALDKYANIATIEVTASSANTLTYQELRTQLGIQPNRRTLMAMIIDEINYYPGEAAIAEMTTTGDSIQMALTISNNPTDLMNVTDRRILHVSLMARMDFGVAAGGVMIELPNKHQFFPPLIMAEKSLYLAINTSGLASAAILRCRIYYRLVEISETEMLELVEVFRLVG